MLFRSRRCMIKIPFLRKEGYIEANGETHVTVSPSHKSFYYLRRKISIYQEAGEGEAKVEHLKSLLEFMTASAPICNIARLKDAMDLAQQHELDLRVRIETEWSDKGLMGMYAHGIRLFNVMNPNYGRSSTRSGGIKRIERFDRKNG